jgi:hypothetical protein
VVPAGGEPSRCGGAQERRRGDRLSHTRFAWLICAATVACSRGDAHKPLVWETVAPGIQHARVEVTGTPAFAGHAFKVELARVDVRVVSSESGKETVDALAAAFPEHLAVNGSFFDPAGKAMGRVVDRGAAVSMTRRSSWGALTIDADSARVVLGDALPKDTPGGSAVLQGVPRLVVDGSVVKLKPQTAARTAVCGEGAVLYVVVTTDAETSELARFLAQAPEKGGLGCKNALNLDGGPSTQLSAKVGAFATQMPGGWGVPNALVIVPRAAGAAPAPALAPDAGAP